MAKMTISGLTYEGTPEELREIVRTFEEEAEDTEEVEKRNAKVGESIRIIDADSPFEPYKNGDKFTVRSSNSERVFVEEHGTLIFHEEYEVIIEETAEPTPKTITHEGAEYMLVDRKARAGDVVEFTSEQVYFTKVKTYGPVDENLDVTDDEGDKLDVYAPAFGRTTENVLVYEKVANAFDKFPKGAKVRLISGGGDFPLLGKDNGAVYTVENNNFNHGGSRKIDIGQAYALPEQLELVDDEPLKVGDKVAVIDGSKSRWDDLGTGAVGEITDIAGQRSQPYEVTAEDDYDRFPAEALRKLSDEEFAKHNRLIPEVGDIVRVEFEQVGIKGGELGEVIHADGSICPRVKIGDTTKYLTVEVVARAKDRVDSE